MRRDSFALGILLAFAASTSTGAAQPFTFAVRHQHVRGQCSGKLTINQDGIEYETRNVKDARRWSYRDLRRIEIASPMELVLHTYESLKSRLGGEKKFHFRLQEGRIDEAIYQFLLSQATRPLVTAVPYPSGPFSFQLPVKHRHRLGGCQGELKVGGEGIVYETSDPRDSRVWLYKDIQSVGQMNPYDFRVTTLVETYTFDLKVAMTAEQYEFVWNKVFRLAGPYSD